MTFPQKQETGDTEKLSYPEGPRRIPVGIRLFFNTLQSCGEQVWDKKGNKVLNRDINHKLTWGTQFQGTQFQLDGAGSRLFPKVQGPGRSSHSTAMKHSSMFVD